MGGREYWKGGNMGGQVTGGGDMIWKDIGAWEGEGIGGEGI